MPETSVVEPLSGLEVIKAISDRVAKVLSRDCFLSPNMAYESFDCEIVIKLRARDLGRENMVNTTVLAAGGEPIGPDDEVDTLEGREYMPPAPPNEVRMQSSQPVPVRVDDGNGRAEIKKIKYTPKPRRQQPAGAGGHVEGAKLPDAEK